MADIFPPPEKKKKKSKIITISNDQEKPVSPKLAQIRREVYSLIENRPANFGAFVARPANIRFESQMPKEKVILLLRRHPITNVKWIFITLLLLTGPFFIKQLPPFTFLPDNFRLVLQMIWYLFVLAFVMEQFFNWFFSVNIVTDERIIDINFVSLIYKRIADADIENIQDTTYKMGGLWGTLFNFGTVYIQTAAERPEFVFEEVPQPDLVAQVLQKMRIEEKQENLEGRIS